MGSFSLWHWLVVLLIVVLVFGTKRLKNVGKDVGEAVRGFKQGMGDDDKGPPGQLGEESRSDPHRNEQSRPDETRPPPRDTDPR